MRWYYKGIFPSENVIVSHLTYGYEGLSSSSSHSVFLVSPVGNKYLVYFIRALVFDICLFVIYQSKVPRRRVLLRPHACLDSVIFRFQSIVDAEREQLEHFPEIVLTSLACWQQVGGKNSEWMQKEAFMLSYSCGISHLTFASIFIAICQDQMGGDAGQFTPPIWSPPLIHFLYFFAIERVLLASPLAGWLYWWWSEIPLLLQL